MKCKLEIIGYNIESCIAAQAGGADRIELCDNPSEGGTTPSYGFIKAAREKLSVELYVIIRPRGGDFLYTDAEFELMKTDVEICKKTGCDGIVMGILNANGNIDKKRCSEIINYAYPLGVTFHRAFDRTVDPFIALEDIIKAGCERILTSGQHQKAIDGSGLIKELISRADDRIIIMPGAGINSANIVSIAESTGAVEFHSSASVYINSEIRYNNEKIIEKMMHVTVDKKEVENMSTLLKAIRVTASEKA